LSLLAAGAGGAGAGAGQWPSNLLDAAGIAGHGAGRADDVFSLPQLAHLSSPSSPLSLLS